MDWEDCFGFAGVKVGGGWAEVGALSLSLCLFLLPLRSLSTALTLRDARPSVSFFSFRAANGMLPTAAAERVSGVPPPGEDSKRWKRVCRVWESVRELSCSKECWFGRDGLVSRATYSRYCTIQWLLVVGGWKSGPRLVEAAKKLWDITVIPDNMSFVATSQTATEYQEILEMTQVNHSSTAGVDISSVTSPAGLSCVARDTTKIRT